ncbi:hypothetical protein ACJMK2_015638 [Sinanodonta woodiana]|uniref:Uncharacterized protein n=1 Tax=Sinanodonta woodiana TaxID=1069815 RepID=A0ABD3UTY1_SINWO
MRPFRVNVKAISLLVLMALIVVMFLRPWSKTIPSNPLSPVTQWDFEDVCQGKQLPKKPCCKSEPQYMIYRCIAHCGRWTDLQKGIVTVYLLSLLSNRTFNIEITYPCSLEKFLQPNTVQWQIQHEKIQHLTFQNFDMLNDHSGNLFYHREIQCGDFSKWFKTDVVYLQTNESYVGSIRRHPHIAELIPWLHTMPLGTAYSYVMKTLFKLSSETEKSISSYFTNHIGKHMLICTQIGEKSFVSVIDPRYSGIWTFFDQYKDESKYRFYISAVSNDTKSFALSRYQKQFVDSPGQVEGQDSCAGFEKTIVEEYILSKCDVLLVTRSSLGIIAAFVRGTNKDLFCYYQRQIFPCAIEVLHEIYPNAL